MPLHDIQIERYSRQIILPEVGGLGQSRLLAAHVALAGDRAVRTWASLYLAAAGVGRLSGCDAADVPLLARLNPDCEATAATLPDADVALLADPAADVALACPTVVVHADGGVGWVSILECGVQRRSGSPADPERSGTPHSRMERRCTPHSRSVLGLLAVTEVLKLILGIGRPLVGRRLVCDVTAASLREEALEGVDAR